MISDIKLAQKVKLKPIKEIAADLGIGEEHLILYGNYKAKISIHLLEKLKEKKDGKLVLVTSMTPTRAGEGKTTTTVGITQALCKLGEKATLCIREPSLGPVMGIKGGAAGGGFSQVLPMEDINLFFTGDIPAVSSANDLLSAAIDNHIFHGNDLHINPTKVSWHRVTDMNDRSLRRIFIGLGDSSGLAREDRYDITAASEVMAVLCLSQNITDLKKRLGAMVIGYTFFGEPVTVEQLGIQGAMAALLRDAFNPNLVQTMEGGPAFIHGGPFANIAHGCSSVMATKIALKLSDIVITEAGFGADLGAEKFMDIKCQQANLKPQSVILVATIRAIKHHGGAMEYEIEDMDALKKGWPNLEKQIENVQEFKVPLVVALNKFETDTENEIEFIKDMCHKKGVEIAVSEIHEKGGDGGIEVAKKLLKTFDMKSNYTPLYSLEENLESKIEKIAKKMYGAKIISYTQRAREELKLLEKQGFGKLPICMAKTQNSLSDDPERLGRPRDFEIAIKKAKVSAGAQFIVVMCGKILLMPGLPKKPSAENIDIKSDGTITGLF